MILYWQLLERNSDMKKNLKACGVTKGYVWTYNYAYFGTRPDSVAVDKLAATVQTTATAATTAVTTADNTVETTYDVGVTEPAPKKSGCGSMLGVSIAALIPVTAVTAFAAKKKEKY